MVASSSADYAAMLPTVPGLRCFNISLEITPVVETIAPGPLFSGREKIRSMEG